jgi:simple sugar transport system ATP-binding protein
MNDQTLIRMTGITKTFPGVVANDSIDFDLRSGEVHSILGENGAGKTTLMNILSGMYQPDEGETYVRGQKVNIRSPHDSLRLGIGMVYQHFALVPPLTVLENIILGFEGGMMLSLKKAEKRLQQLAAEYGLTIDYRQKVSDLSVGERQRAEIIKILYRGSEILVLDEPTSVLTPIEAKELFRTLDSLRKMGKAVVLITHKLSEALAISDRITILKLGRKAAELDGDELRQMGHEAASEKILHMMFGDMPIAKALVVAKELADQVVLGLDRVKAINTRGVVGLKAVTLTIHKGEIFGIAGVDGNGQKTLAEVIGGQRKIESGQILFKGKDISHASTCDRFEMGISYITDDRIGEGCVPDMDLAENAIIQCYYQLPYSRHMVINNQVINAHADDLIRQFNIKANGPGDRAGTLSGGNIQKFILARGLCTKPALVVCNKPTYGLDARTVRYIQELLLEESKQGSSILLISSDMDELLNYSDRIGVLFNGELLAVLDRADAAPEKIGKLMLGIKS